jgi:hypothetical protein
MSLAICEQGLPRTAFSDEEARLVPSEIEIIWAKS